MTSLTCLASWKWWLRILGIVNLTGQHIINMMSLLCLKSVNSRDPSLPSIKVSYGWGPYYSSALGKQCHLCPFINKTPLWQGGCTTCILRHATGLRSLHPASRRLLKCQLLLMLNLMLMLTDAVRAMRNEYFIFNVNLSGFLFKNPSNAHMAVWGPTVSFFTSPSPAFPALIDWCLECLPVEQP